MGLRPGLFFEMFLFALRAGCLTDNVFKGHAARAFFALRAFCLRRGTFCSPKKFLKNGSLRWPCGALASLATLLELSSSAPISEGRGALCKTWSVSAMPFEATSKNMPHPQPSWSHSKQPRNIRLTCNPLGAFLLRTLQRGSRGVGQKLGGCQHCSLHSTSCLRHEAFK